MTTTSATATQCDRCEQECESVRASYAVVLDVTLGVGALNVCDSHLDVLTQEGLIVSSSLI